MTLVELNIGLGEPTTRRGHLDWPERLRLALDWVYRQGRASVRFRPRSRDRGSEHTLVVSMSVSDPAMGGFTNQLLGLANDIEQDAIAMLIDNTVGLMVGPAASKWEPFDRDRFITLEDA